VSEGDLNSPSGGDGRCQRMAPGPHDQRRWPQPRPSSIAGDGLCLEIRDQLVTNARGSSISTAILGPRVVNAVSARAAGPRGLGGVVTYWGSGE